MSKIPDNITRQNLISAIERIDEEGIPNGARSSTYDVIFKGKRYPPKVVVSFANSFANGTELDRGTFEGGVGTECFKLLEANGFEIVNKASAGVEEVSIVELINGFISQAATSDLKTRNYPNKLDELEIKVSFGQGNPAQIPWIAFLRDGQTVKEGGLYPVFLFYKDHDILILAKGRSETKSPIVDWVGEGLETISNYFSKQGLEKPKRYGDSYVYRAYELENNAWQASVENDLSMLLGEYRQLDLSEPERESSMSILPKPFLLLAGISGTGKTRFVREQANSHDLNGDNFCLVPVRPDWHEPSDLLGYISRLGGTPKYISTKVLEFIIEAWKAVAPNASASGMGELDLNSAPYWLCLDEMNLAPVEQYFADYLSVLESRKFDNGEYSCEPLLDKSVLSTPGANVQHDLKLTNNQDLWEYFCNNGIGLPPNLLIAGTVNMDETTHGFSRKVIDRALTVDFGEFFPNDFNRFFEGQAIPKALTFSTKTDASRDSIGCSADPDGQKTVAFLNDVNSILRNTPFELAFRALNEALLFVDAFSPSTDAELQAVWDDFLMSKVLPRIEGDDDKLSTYSNREPSNILDQLQKILESQLGLIWAEDKYRIDLFREDADGAQITDVSCRSRKKLDWMKDRLATNTFTSFWP